VLLRQHLNDTGVIAKVGAVKELILDVAGVQ